MTDYRINTRKVWTTCFEDVQRALPPCNLQIVPTMMKSAELKGSFLESFLEGMTWSSNRCFESTPIHIACLDPRSWTWKLKSKHLKRTLILQASFFRVYGQLQGCKAYSLWIFQITEASPYCEDRMSWVWTSKTGWWWWWWWWWWWCWWWCWWWWPVRGVRS